VREICPWCLCCGCSSTDSDTGTSSGSSSSDGEGSTSEQTAPKAHQQQQQHQQLAGTQGEDNPAASALSVDTSAIRAGSSRGEIPVPVAVAFPQKPLSFSIGDSSLTHIFLPCSCRWCAERAAAACLYHIRLCTHSLCLPVARCQLLLHPRRRRPVRFCDPCVRISSDSGQPCCRDLWYGAHHTKAAPALALCALPCALAK
jgi:hypothetical protein